MSIAVDEKGDQKDLIETGSGSDSNVTSEMAIAKVNALQLCPFFSWAQHATRSTTTAPQSRNIATMPAL
jgi:hypothetical protein